MMKTFNQCRMRKNNSIVVSWIPSKFAKVGNTVGLKHGEQWDEGWKVLSVGSMISEKRLQEQEKRLRNGSHRKGSDI